MAVSNKIFKIAAMIIFLFCLTSFIAYQVGLFDNYIYGEAAEEDNINLKKVEVKGFYIDSEEMYLSSSKSSLIFTSDEIKMVDKTPDSVIQKKFENKEKKQNKESVVEDNMFFSSSKSMKLPRKITVKDTVSKFSEEEFRLMGSSKSIVIPVPKKDSTKK